MNYKQLNIRVSFSLGIHMNNVVFFKVSNEMVNKQGIQIHELWTTIHTKPRKLLPCWSNIWNGYNVWNVRKRIIPCTPTSLQTRYRDKGINMNYEFITIERNGWVDLSQTGQFQNPPIKHNSPAWDFSRAMCNVFQYHFANRRIIKETLTNVTG